LAPRFPWYQQAEDIDHEHDQEKSRPLLYRPHPSSSRSIAFPARQTEDDDDLSDVNM
jgi:hypothetical protein